MKLRARLVGSGLMTIISRDTFLNARALKHMLNAEQASELFPPGTGINFSFFHDPKNDSLNKITLHHEGGIEVSINSLPLQPHETHNCVVADIKELKIGHRIIQLDVLQSDF